MGRANTNLISTNSAVAEATKYSHGKISRANESFSVKIYKAIGIASTTMRAYRRNRH